MRAEDFFNLKGFGGPCNDEPPAAGRIRQPHRLAVAVRIPETVRQNAVADAEMPHGCGSGMESGAEGISQDKMPQPPVQSVSASSRQATRIESHAPPPREDEARG